MPVGLRSHQTAQMVVLDTPDTVGEVNAWAFKARLPKSELLRRAFFGKGWPALRRELEREYGALSPVDRRYGVLCALPKGERTEYATKHELSQDDPRCLVKLDEADEPGVRSVVRQRVAKGAEE